MPYIEEICEAGQTLEVCRYYSYRIHIKGEKRALRGKTTEEAQKRVNHRKAEKELRRLMNANFRDGDYLVRLDFFRENLPEGSAQMQKLISRAMRKLKTAAAKAGTDLKYLYVKEVGPRGGRHVHLMLSKVDTDLLRSCWPHGGIHVDPLHSDGQYRKIAAYFLKYAFRTEETEGRLIGKKWYSSRNLERPKVEKRIIPAGKFREDIRERKGYTLEKDSVQSGISEFTGYAYLSYTLLRNGRKEEKDAESRHLYHRRHPGTGPGGGQGHVPPGRRAAKRKNPGK